MPLNLRITSDVNSEPLSDCPSLAVIVHEEAEILLGTLIHYNPTILCLM